jgi:hypothetical protein
MAMTIDKDNPGSGILLYQVPDGFTAKDAYLEFCPQSGGSLGVPHCPDSWDCSSNPVRWRIAE